jgi:hypothetical protein
MWNTFLFSIFNLCYGFLVGKSRRQTFLNVPDYEDPSFEDYLKRLLSPRTSLVNAGFGERDLRSCTGCSIAGLRPEIQKKPLWSTQGPIQLTKKLH